jgi:hypothetical protein
MPTVASVDGVGIVFHFNDHPPPHFHAIIAEHRAMIDIETLEIVKGSIPRAKYRQIRSWAQSRREKLLKAWLECQSGETPEPIP